MLCTANIFNVIFTLFTCVPLSTVTARLVLQVQTNKWKVDLQFFYCNFYIGLYMANICKVYTFNMCPVSTVFSLHIFAVWHKPNKGKKRNHNMFGVVFSEPKAIAIVLLHTLWLVWFGILQNCCDVFAISVVLKFIYS